MKKYLIIFFTVLFVFSFAACNKNSTDETTSSTEEASTTNLNETKTDSDDFGKFFDGTKAESETAENKTTSTAGTSKLPVSENNSSPATSATITASEPSSGQAVPTPPSTSKAPDKTETSEPFTGGLTVGEFEGGDSEDFGDLW